MNQDLYARINDRGENIRMVVTDTERRAFDALPPGPSTKYVEVTDQLTGNRGLVYRADCGAGCYCAARVTQTLERFTSLPIEAGSVGDIDIRNEPQALDRESDPRTRNLVRARWAAAALQAYAGETGEQHEPYEAIISDLLGDLMHLVDALEAGDSLQPDYWPGYDEDGAFDGLLGVARRRYEEEVEGEP